MSKIETHHTLPDLEGKAKKNSERNHPEIFEQQDSSEIEIKKGTQSFGSVLEDRNLKSQEMVAETQDFQEFKKEIDFDFLEIQRNLDKFKGVIGNFSQDMEKHWKEWREKINTSKDFDYFKSDFEKFSRSVLENYREERQKLFDKWQEFYDLYQSLNDFEKNAETEFNVTSEGGKTNARYMINMTYGPALISYLQTFQNFDERLAGMEKQWMNLTELFNKYVLEKTRAEYRDYKRMEKRNLEVDDMDDFEIKTVDEKFDLRADNVKKEEALRPITLAEKDQAVKEKRWTEIDEKNMKKRQKRYEDISNVFNFIRSFLATKNFGVSENDLYKQTDLEYALISDLALGNNAKFSNLVTSEMLGIYYSWDAKYSLPDLMSALAAYCRGEIKKHYEDKSVPIDEKILNQDSYYLKIIKELMDTPEPLERLSKKSGDTIPPMRVNY